MTTSSRPTDPAPCYFCGAPSAQIIGIRPVCSRCLPVVREINERNLAVMLTFFRDVARRVPENKEAA